MSIASASFIRFCTTSILSETFAPPSTATNGRSGFEIGFAEIGQFLFHQQAGGRLAHELGDAHNRSMRAMRRAKGVADEKPIAERGKLLRKSFVVGFFFGVKAHIFEQQHCRRCASALLFASASAPTQSAANSTGLPSSSCKPRGHRRKAVLRIHFALGPAEMRREHQPRAALIGKPQRGQGLADARVVGHFAAIERHVEIHADEDALARPYPDRESKVCSWIVPKSPRRTRRIRA